MVSTKGRYALRVMIDIAMYSAGNYITLKDIAERQDISLKYLEQVIALLNKAGLVQSLRGNNGGYRLAKEAKEITAGEILRATEGSLSCVNCLMNQPNQCKRIEFCSTIEFWKGFDGIVNSYVDSITLEELTNNYRNKLGYDYSI